MILPGRRAAWRPRSWSWWITAVNLLGSIAFGVSAVASYVNPANGQLRNAGRANLGTLIGAVCFLYRRAAVAARTPGETRPQQVQLAGMAPDPDP